MLRLIYAYSYSFVICISDLAVQEGKRSPDGCLRSENPVIRLPVLLSRIKLPGLDQDHDVCHYVDDHNDHSCHGLLRLIELLHDILRRFDGLLGHMSVDPANHNPSRDAAIFRVDADEVTYVGIYDPSK